MEALAEPEEVIAPTGEVNASQNAIARRLDELRIPARGRVAAINVPHDCSERHGVSPEELERRLLEIGFVEGAKIEILHEGLIRRDPIVVKIDGMRVALRRREAHAILVHVES
jgi:ferrous iron transport protein A